MEKFGLRRLAGVILIIGSVVAIWYVCSRAGFTLEENFIYSLGKSLSKIATPIISLLITFILGCFLVFIQKEEVVEKVGKVIAYVGFFGIISIFLGVGDFLPPKEAIIAIGGCLGSFVVGSILSKAWKWV